MISTYYSFLEAVLKKNGQGVVEYLFLISLIAIAAMVTLMALGQHLLNFFDSFSNYLSILV